MDLTFGDMIERCVDRLGVRESETRSIRVIKSELNAAHDMVCAGGDYDWLEAGPTTVSVDGTTTAVSVPTGWRNVVHVELVSTGKPLPYRDLPIRSAQMLESVYYRSRGTPDYWNAWGRSILTDPLPGHSDSLRLYGILQTVEMVDNGDEPLVPGPFRQLIVEEALANLSSRLTMDVRIQARARDNAERLTRNLKSRGAIAHPRIRYIPNLRGQF